MARQRCVFVIGPESSGSKLVARICSHVLKIADFDEWDGTAWSDQGEHRVLHRSLPYGLPPVFPDIEEWINAYSGRFEILFVLTTRDISISQISRRDRWGKTAAEVREQSERAREILARLIHSDQRYMIWSYETFMYLKADYLSILYRFLGVQSNFLPPLIDGNAIKVISRE